MPPSFPIEMVAGIFAGIYLLTCGIVWGMARFIFARRLPPRDPPPEGCFIVASAAFGIPVAVGYGLSTAFIWPPLYAFPLLGFLIALVGLSILVRYAPPAVPSSAPTGPG